MAKKAEYTFDPSQVIKMFEDFNEKERKKVFRSTLRRASGILVRETKKKLRENIGDAASHSNRWNGKPLSAGIKAKVAKNDRMVKVNIMGDFRLKFFEAGTDDRFTKKRGRRGRIKPTHFFKEAKAATEEIVFSSFSKNLAKTIERIYVKRHG